VRLALFVFAYNLGNFLRRFALPGKISHWSLRSIQLELIKTGARHISHSRMTIFGHLRSGLFCGRGTSGRDGVRCNRISDGDIEPERGKITMLGG
jgi:hypothetical protein